MALFSLGFAGWGILEITDADYLFVLICFANTLLFGLWARALLTREHS
jgi:hypothetical protein